jgi:hypothetical protein
MKCCWAAVRLSAGQTPAAPLSLVADYLSGALGAFIKWWLSHQLSYPAQQMDDMFQQLVMPGVWAALRKDGPT